MKTIKLIYNGLGRYDDASAFVMANNSIEIKTELPNVNGEFFFIAENGGRTFKKFLQRDKTITLDNLTAGELTAEVKHYVKGMLVKVYKIEPLILCEVDGNLTGTPEIAVLSKSIGKLEQTIAEIKENAEKREKELESVIENLKTNLYALIRFAYSDFNLNTFLDGGTYEDFVGRFGFELTEEEKNQLFGGIEND